MSQARLPRTEPSTELITAHKVNTTATLMRPRRTAAGFFGSPEAPRLVYKGHASPTLAAPGMRQASTLVVNRSGAQRRPKSG